MVLACDLRIGLQGIEWRMPATALGLHYYPSGLQRYVSRFGLAAAKRAFLTARPFTAQQLDALGLFEALVGPEDWAQTQQALLQDILALAPLAVQETKKSLNEIAAGVMNETRLRERPAEPFAQAVFVFCQKDPHGPIIRAPQIPAERCLRGSGAQHGAWNPQFAGDKP